MQDKLKRTDVEFAVRQSNKTVRFGNKPTIEVGSITFEASAGCLIKILICVFVCVYLPVSKKKLKRGICFARVAIRCIWFTLYIFCSSSAACVAILLLSDEQSSASLSRRPEAEADE